MAKKDDRVFATLLMGGLAFYFFNKSRKIGEGTIVVPTVEEYKAHTYNIVCVDLKTREMCTRGNEAQGVWTIEVMSSDPYSPLAPTDLGTAESRESAIAKARAFIDERVG